MSTRQVGIGLVAAVAFVAGNILLSNHAAGMVFPFLLLAAGVWALAIRGDDTILSDYGLRMLRRLGWFLTALGAADAVWILSRLH